MVTGDKLNARRTVHHQHAGINPAELVHPCPLKFDTRSYLDIHRSLADIPQLFWGGFMGMRACTRGNEDDDAGMLTCNTLHELFLRQDSNSNGDGGSPIIRWNRRALLLDTPGCHEQDHHSCQRTQYHNYGIVFARSGIVSGLLQCRHIFFLHSSSNGLGIFQFYIFSNLLISGKGTVRQVSGEAAIIVGDLPADSLPGVSHKMADPVNCVFGDMALKP